MKFAILRLLATTAGIFTFTLSTARAEPRSYHGLNRVGLFDNQVDDRVLATDIINNWEEYVYFLPPPRVTSLSSLVNHNGRQIFELTNAPTIQELRTQFESIRGEFGVMHLFGHWYASINGDDVTFWGEDKESLPLKDFGQLLAEIDGSGLADFDLHSHPRKDRNAFLPTFEDEIAFHNSNDGEAYLITAKGFMKFSCPVSLRNSSQKTFELYNSWTKDSLKLTEDQIKEIGRFELQQLFFEKFCELQFVSDQVIEKKLRSVIAKSKFSSCSQAIR